MRNIVTSENKIKHDAEFLAKKVAGTKNLPKRNEKITKGSEVDYRGEHGAPGPGAGSPMHNVKGTYPADFYESKGFGYYADMGQPYDRESYDAVMRAKDKPEKLMWAYRAVPSDVHAAAMKTDSPLKHMIRPGDWVSTSKKYAEEHGEGALQGKYKIAMKRVPASHLYTSGDSIHEWGYNPE